MKRLRGRKKERNNELVTYKLFGLEGTSTLGDESFSLEKVAIKFSNPVDGKLKFTAEAIDKTVNSFFMRMKMK